LDAHSVLVTSSATTALQCAVAAVPNLELGDEILVADFSFPASANAVAWLGYKPVLVDSEETQFGMDIDFAEELVSEKTKGVIAVDPFGLNPNFEKITAFCKKHSLFLIEDAACALGTRYLNQQLGTFGDIGCLSFHPRKLVNSGEGGALISSRSDTAELLQKLRSHGFRLSGLFPDFDLIGTNARLSEFASALGIRQLKLLDSEIRGRNQVYEMYLNELGDFPQVTFPKIPKGTDWNYQTLTLQVTSLSKRNEVVERLRNAGISSTLGTYATHSQKAYRRYGYQAGDLPNSLNFQNKLFAIPMHSQLSKREVRQISRIIRTIL
jgi:dTDP-4-amino-4,6-dideoxygalactose transaminase